MVPFFLPMKYEEQEQIALIEWFSLKYPSFLIDLHHSPNEAKRSVGEWAKLKRMGLKKGFSDIFIAVPRNDYHGLFIELKSKRANGKYGKPTEEQVDFINRKAELGYCAYICYGLDDAMDRISEYFS